MEEKLRSLERLKTMESSEAALAALRRHISRPLQLFDRYEATNLLQSLIRLARSEGDRKAEEYAAALDEVTARSNYLEDLPLQRLFLGLLGDPVRAKVAKDATSILKNVGSSARAQGYAVNIARRPSPYQAPSYAQVQCFRCLGWGHLARSCRNGSRQFPRGRGRAGRRY